MSFVPHYILYTDAQLPGCRRAPLRTYLLNPCEEEKRRLLPERVTVPSPGVLKDTVPLKQWECSAPLQVYVKAPGTAATSRPQVHLRNPLPPPPLPLEISLQVTSRLSRTEPPPSGTESICGLASRSYLGRRGAPGRNWKVGT